MRMQNEEGVWVDLGEVQSIEWQPGEATNDEAARLLREGFIDYGEITIELHWCRVIYWLDVTPSVPLC